jgi:glucokinase
VARGVSESATRADAAAVDLLVKIYSAAIANHMTHHMCTGGMYLVGSITNSLLPRIKDKNILASPMARHPEVAHMISKIPLVVCKEIELGLKGAYFVARSILLA